MKLVLASTSPYRKKLLERMGYSFDTASPNVDESRVRGEMPAALAQRLARLKAEAIAAQDRDAYVIGSDQVIALGDDVLSKPGSVSAACEQLARLSGQTHQLMTAVCVAHAGETYEAVMTHHMVMRELTPGEIEAYVAADEPLDCAGSYKIEERGIALFESLRGDDYTSIIGLPLTIVRRLLAEAGYEER